MSGLSPSTISPFLLPPKKYKMQRTRSYKRRRGRKKKIRRGEFGERRRVGGRGSRREGRRRVGGRGDMWLSPVALYFLPLTTTTTTTAATTTTATFSSSCPSPTAININTSFRCLSRFPLLLLVLPVLLFSSYSSYYC